MPRKHLIASQTNKKQQLQAKIWFKLAKEIKAAVKVAGSDPNTNPRLKSAIVKALQNNLSKASIEKNIQGANKDPTNLLSLTYECFGPNGSQFIINVLTDNQNRTLSDLKGYLSKLGGQFVKPNSVKKFFHQYSIFLLSKEGKITKDMIVEALLEYDLVDVIEHEDLYEVIASSNQFYPIKEKLEKQEFKIFSAEIKLATLERKEINDELAWAKIEKFIEQCNNNDDIQLVVSNVL